MLFCLPKITIPKKYSDFSDDFSEKKTLKLLKQTELNQHAIELKNGKRPLYVPIYSLGPVELETLNTYIETQLKTGFIRSSKSPSDAPIFFDKKLDSSFHLCVSY